MSETEEVDGSGERGRYLTSNSSIGIHDESDVARRTTLRPVPSRTFLWWSLALVIFVLGSRWPLRSRYLFSWDSANFAQALDSYNVAFHHPHPPGYPLYVATAWLVRNMLGDANSSFVALSLAASIAASILLLGLSWRLYGQRVAVLATALFVCSPNTWGHGEVSYPYTFLALGAITVAWCAAETRCGHRDLTIPGAVCLGLGGGFRPDLVVFLFPIWLLGSWRRGWRGFVIGAMSMVVVVVAWLIPTVTLSGGVSAYLGALSDYLEVWGPPVDGSPIAIAVSTGRNMAELAGFGARSLGPIWATLIVFSVGRLLSPWALATDHRTRLLMVWVIPALLFYALVHIGNFGYLLSVLPAFAILGGRIAVDLAGEATALVIRAAAYRGAWARTAAVAIVVTSCVAEAGIFLLSRGPVSLAEIRDVDARLSTKIAYLSALDPETTLVLAYDRFAQLEYYLPAYAQRGNVRSLDALLGPDTRPLNRHELALPAHIGRVVIADLDIDIADRPTGLRRVELGRAAWIYEGGVRSGDILRYGYGFARIASAKDPVPTASAP